MGSSTVMPSRPSYATPAERRERRMIAEKQTKANVGVGIGILLQVIGRVMY
jgi:hypothetical protein